ncbi:MAG: hypothetical protein GXP63_06850, partial [DPANN group archaeon]|nr:hypothetical protein [DPANN group archaeon]
MDDPKMSFIEDKILISSKFEILSPLDKVGLSLNCSLTNAKGISYGDGAAIISKLSERGSANKTSTITPQTYEFKKLLVAECYYLPEHLVGGEQIFRNTITLQGMDTKSVFPELALSSDKFYSEQRNYGKDLPYLDTKDKRVKAAREFYHYMYPGESTLFEQKIGTSGKDWNPDSLQKFLPVIIILDEPLPILPISEEPGRVQQLRYVIRFEKPDLSEREQRKTEVHARINDLRIGLHKGLRPVDDADDRGQPRCRFSPSAVDEDDSYYYFPAREKTSIRFKQLLVGETCWVQIDDPSLLITSAEAEVPTTML